MSTDFYQADDASELSTQRPDANRDIARHGAGLQTATGKGVSSRSTTVTGLTGRTVLLASDDVDNYTFHLSRHCAEYLPVTEAESELVQTIADCEWRLQRILVLEGGIYALGEMQFGESFSEEAAEVRSAMIKAQTLLTHQRTLSNLSIQESRLHCQKGKAIAALEELKKNRPQAPVGVYARAPLTSSATALAAAVSASGFKCSSASQSAPLAGQPTSRSNKASLAAAH